MGRDFSIQIPSGRTLEVSEAGDPRGLPVFTLHGTPGSRLLYPPHVADAESRHIRLIGYNRPGYGGSTSLRGRRIAETAEDAAAIADHLGLEKFAVWGISGGGAPALACASILPRRVVAASSLAGVAPYLAEGLDWFAGMGEFNIEDFKLMLSDQDGWVAKNRRDADELLKADEAGIAKMFATLLSDVDRSVLSGELAAYLRAQIQEAFKAGIEGMCDDGLASCKPWGFDATSIRVPVQIWHGRQDRFVPFPHGEWLASHVPGAEAHFEREQGHLSLFERKVPEVHAWLASKF